MHIDVFAQYGLHFGFGAGGGTGVNPDLGLDGLWKGELGASDFSPSSL